MLPNRDRCPQLLYGLDNIRAIERNMRSGFIGLPARVGCTQSQTVSGFGVFFFFFGNAPSVLCEFELDISVWVVCPWF